MYSIYSLIVNVNDPVEKGTIDLYYKFLTSSYTTSYNLGSGYPIAP